jgi:hypothetical protein
MKKFLIIFLILCSIVLVVWIYQQTTKDDTDSAPKQQQTQQLHSGKIRVVKNGSRGYGIKLMKELEYLNKVEEIVWVEIEDNDVYIGFDPVPSDWELIIRAAAFNGNRAIDFGTHVWAAYGSRRGWRPGQSKYLGEVTARYGKVQ